MGWGLADIYYKKSSNETDTYSHLKLAVWVGLVMGVCAAALLPLTESSFTAASLAKNALRYAPASLCYILSMVIGYAGLRYLELSIVSPIQNASGALSAICMTVWFLAVGRITELRDVFSLLDMVGTALIVVGVVALAIAEQRMTTQSAKKYRYGALALLFPLLYCVFDTAGTAADGILLDGTTGLGLGEIDVIVLYGLTFFVMGLAAWLFLLIREKKPYNPFARSERSKAVAAVCEEFGQVFYVYAMAAKPVLAAPMVAGYCVVSVLLSRVMLGENLGKGRYACVVLVMCGILFLAVSEGLAMY